METSGHYLSIDGIRVNTASPYGQNGLWLLDPIAINIVNGGSGTLTGGIFDPFVSTDIAPATITGVGGLQDNNVTIQTVNGGGGIITVSDPVSWNSVNSLSLVTDGAIAVQADLTNAGSGNIVLNSTGAGITVDSSSTVSTAGDVQITSAGTFSSAVGSSISGNNVSIFTTGGGYLTIGGAISSAAAGSVTLKTAGVYPITTVGGGTVTSNTINLQSDGQNGTVGESGNPFLTSSIGGSGNANINIGFNTVGPNAVYLDHTGDATLQSVFINTDAPVAISASNNLTAACPIGTGTSSLSLGAGGLLTVSAAVTLAGANIDLHVNRLSIDTSGSPATVNAGTGMTWISPYTAGWGMDLGSITDVAANTLELSDSELDRILTGGGVGTLRIGSLTSGNLAVSAAISPLNASFLSLESGGTITQAAAGTIGVTNLAVNALGDVSLDTAANSVTNLAASIGDASNPNKNFKFKNSGDLNIATGIDGISGVNISLDGTYDPLAPDGVIALTSAGVLSQSAGALLAGKAVYAEGSSVNLYESNPTGVIAGSATGGATSSFIYKSVNGIYVSQVDGKSGISVPNNATDPVVFLDNSGAGASAGIVQATVAYDVVDAPIGTVGNPVALVARSDGDILFYSPNNYIKELSALSSSTNDPGGIVLATNSALTVVSKTPVGGTTVTGVTSLSNVRLDSATSITVDRTGTNNPYISGTYLFLDAPSISLKGDVGGTTAPAVNSILTDGAGGKSVFMTDALTVTNTAMRTADTTMGGLAILPLTNGRNVTVGSATCQAGPCLALDNVSETTFVGPFLRIGNDDVGLASDPDYPYPVSGDLAVAAAVTRTEGLMFATGGTVSQVAGATITTGSLGIIGSSVTLTEANSVDMLVAKTTGAFAFTNNKSLTIDSIPYYTGYLSSITTQNSDVTISINGGVGDVLSVPTQIDAGTGTVNLISSGSVWGTSTSPDVIAGLVNITAPYGIDGDSGFHTQTPRIATLSAPNGKIYLRNFSDVILGPSTPDNGVTAIQGGSTGIEIYADTYQMTINGNIEGPGGIDLYAGSILQNVNITTTASVDPGVYVYASSGNIVMDPGAVTTTSGASISYNAPAGTVTYTASNFSGATPTITQYVAPATSTTTEPPPPTLDACIADPTLDGCTTVLPSVDDCTADPSAAGCTTVLPSVDDCTADPTLDGCTTVLPSVDDCIADPSAAGCTTVLPSVDACIADPSAAGCGTVLPSIDACVANPSAAGCSAVLPSISACTANPSAAGCSAVLPTLDACVANPAAAGCSAVLPAGDTKPAEVVKTVQDVVTVDVDLTKVSQGEQPNGDVQSSSTPASSGDSGGGNGDDEKKRQEEAVASTTTAEERPLAKQPIFDLSGGGVAGQNMVCK